MVRWFCLGISWWNTALKKCESWMKGTEQFFPVVLFILLNMVVSTCKSMGYANYWAVLRCGTVYHTVQGGSNFWVCGWNPNVWPLKWKLLSSTSLKSLSVTIHSNESRWAVLPCGTVYYAVQGGSNFWVFGWNPYVWPLKWKLLSSTSLCNCVLCCARWL